MNELLKGLKTASNVTTTANGATTYKSTMNKVYDLFATGAAMRNASEEDCVLLFKNAYEEDKSLALKCVFYLRDVRGGGQGERRFFRACINWLGKHYPREMQNLIKQIPEFGRWDDLYSLVGTSVEKDMFKFMYDQAVLDVSCQTPSLLAKWLKSENTSSQESRKLATKTREAFGLSPREYRKMLSTLRARINIVETLMSQNRWDEIEFDKLPSRAGLIYKNAFARHDVTKTRYEKFMKDETTKVNAGTLYPYDVVHEVTKLWGHSAYNGWWGYNNYELKVGADDVNRLAINKYWDNLTDYFHKATLNALAVIDTSGSMTTSVMNSGVCPMDIAISLGLYCAERANGPFKNHFISFSSRPQLIETVGVDFCDKVSRIYRQNLCENTNIEATFDLILNTAVKSHLNQKDLPESLIIVTDMQFDVSRGYGYGYYNDNHTLMENIEAKWRAHGYKMPSLVFWNVNAASGGGNIPMRDKNGITFVSGASPVIFEQVIKGLTGQQLMLQVLNAERYALITSIYSVGK